MSSLVDLSLDEIISRDSRQKKKGGARRLASGRSSRPVQRQRSSTFAPKYQSPDSVFTKSKNVPTGKWGHDGFEEMYGGNAVARKEFTKVRAGGRSFERAALSRKVTIHITNLAPTVTSDDLSELFEQYAVDSAVVNYDEAGQSAGSADVMTDRASAQEITANFSGVAIDGRTMRMYIIDDREGGVNRSRSLNVKQRLTFKTTPLRSRGINKRSSSARPAFRSVRGGVRGGATSWKGSSRGRKAQTSDPRKKMTEAELDRELDEYMKKGGGNDGMEA